MIHTAARRVPALGPWLEWLERELSEHRVAHPAALSRIASTVAA